MLKPILNLYIIFSTFGQKFDFLNYSMYLYNTKLSIRYGYIIVRLMFQYPKLQQNFNK